jgi:hypothetical protein
MLSLNGELSIIQHQREENISGKPLKTDLAEATEIGELILAELANTS